MVSFLPCLLTLCEKLNHDVVTHIFSNLITLYHWGKLDIDIDDEEIWWTGPCSIGHLTRSHPRIYLRPPYTTTFVTDEEIEGLNTTREQFLGYLETGEYPDDCGHFKYDTLPFVIKMLEEGIKGSYEYSVYTSVEWRDRDEYNESTICDEIDHLYTLSDDRIVINLHSTQKGWIIHDKDCVLDELKVVRDKCIARNISWLDFS